MLAVRVQAGEISGQLPLCKSCCRGWLGSGSACLDVVCSGELGDEGLGNLANLGIEERGVVACRGAGT